MNSLRKWFLYARTRLHHTNAQRAMIRDWVTPPLLDVGCGDGWLLQGEGQRDGIDNADRNALPKHAHEHDITEPWPVEDESYRTVTAIHVVEHLNPRDFFHVFREAERVLERGGHLVVETPGVSRVWWTIDHVKPYPPQAINKWLERDQYKPVPDFEMIWRWDWGRTELKVLRPFGHFLANLGLLNPTQHLMVFKKGKNDRGPI